MVSDPLSSLLIKVFNESLHNFVDHAPMQVAAKLIQNILRHQIFGMPTHQPGKITKAEKHKQFHNVFIKYGHGFVQIFKLTKTSFFKING